MNTKFPFDHPDTTEKVHGAIQGMVHSFDDPYTTFFPPSDAESFREEISGQFAGVGMEVSTKEGLLTVVAPLQGTPAQQAGIKSGDIILEIDGESTENQSITASIQKIRGEVGEPVDLEIYRESSGEFLSITVIRDIVDIPVIDAVVNEEDIGIISLYSFTDNSRELVQQEIKAMLGTPLRGLVLDLRGNPGGVLEQAVGISSLFLPEGSLVTIEEGANGYESLEHRTKRTPIVPESLEVIVLIDRGSASASEIVAGALRDNDRAVLVGEESFGKGSVQELIPVGKGAALKVTVAQWITPNGTSLRETGLEPDIMVTIEDTEQDDSSDPILEAALDLLIK